MQYSFRISENWGYDSNRFNQNIKKVIQLPPPPPPPHTIRMHPVICLFVLSIKRKEKQLVDIMLSWYHAEE